MDAARFRQVMSHFVSGVTVVTTVGKAGDKHGMTCSAFTSISAAPPSIMVCLTNKTRTEQMLQETGIFVVHILGMTQTLVADRFAGRHHDRERDRFHDLTWAPGTVGAPVIAGCRAHIECRLAQAIKHGDHTLCIGNVEALACDPAVEPLVYSQGLYARLATVNP